MCFRSFWVRGVVHVTQDTGHVMPSLPARILRTTTSLRPSTNRSRFRPLDPIDPRRVVASEPGEQTHLLMLLGQVSAVPVADVKDDARLSVAKDLRRVRG